MSDPVPLTPATLLPALQTPLEHLTRSLPALHHTLGLPPSALSSDLAQLRDSLLNAIAHQLEKRQAEVKEWEGRCAEVEGRVEMLRRKVGGWARGVEGLGAGAGAGVEEGREDVLPTRLESLTRVEHRLAGLHAAKLEQLSILSARLTTISRNLPEGFFPPESLNIHPRTNPLHTHTHTHPPAHAELSTAHLNTTSDAAAPAQPAHKAEAEEDEEEEELEDVTPERFSALEHDLLRGKNEITKRLTHLCHLFSDLLYLHTDLVLPFPSPPPPETEHDAPTALTSSVNLLPAGQKGSSPCPMTSAAPEALFAQFIARLEEVETEGFEPGDDLTGMEGIDPTPEVVGWAEGLKRQLEHLKTEREGRIQEIYDQLESLWRRLGIPESEIDQFVEDHRGSSAACVLAYEAELERMQAMKREKMSVFVGNARKEIAQLWEEIMYGEAEREAFAPFFDDDHTEDLLTRHETEIARLRLEKTDKLPILSHVHRYFQLCDEERELEIAAQDPSRLLGKRGDAGRLLREEKMRKRVQREKPKLEKELLELVPAWEAQHEMVFLVHGQPLRAIIEESREAAEGRKENKRHKTTAKAPPPPARTQTPAEPMTASRKRTRTPSANADPAPSTAVKRQKTAHTTHAPATAPAAARTARPLAVATNIYETPGYAAPKLPGTGTVGRSASAMPGSTYSKLGYGAPPPQSALNSTARLPTSTAVFGSNARIPSATEERIRSAQHQRTARGKKESFRPRPSAVFGLGAGVGGGGMGGMIKVSTDFAGIKGPGWEAVREEEDEEL